MMMHLKPIIVSVTHHAPTPCGEFYHLLHLAGPVGVIVDPGYSRNVSHLYRYSESASMTNTGCLGWGTFHPGHSTFASCGEEISDNQCEYNIHVFWTDCTDSSVSEHAYEEPPPAYF
jgi:hypothetical protein